MSTYSTFDPSADVLKAIPRNYITFILKILFGRFRWKFYPISEFVWFISHGKSESDARFRRYLTLFMNLLNDTESQGEKEVSEHGYQTEESTALRNATIQAMSNLLGANIDSGLSYSLRE